MICDGGATCILTKTLENCTQCKPKVVDIQTAQGATLMSTTHHIETRFFSKLYHFFLQKTTFFSKPNSALFDRSHCSRRQSDTMCLWRRDWMFAPTIRYQFKRHLFNRRPCTGPHLWAGPHARLQRLANCVSISFNLVVINPRCLANLRSSSRKVLSRPIQLRPLNRLAMTGPAMLIRMHKIPIPKAILKRRRNKRGLALF